MMYFFDYDTVKDFFVALTYGNVQGALVILGLIYLNPLDTSASRHRLPTNIRLPKPSRKYSMASISESCC